jgi:hypothetical protein
MPRKKIVYWSPQDKDVENNKNWNILYDDISSLYETLNKEKNKSVSNNFFRCPSFINKTKNIFVVNNPLHSKFKIENNQQNGSELNLNSTLVPISKSYISSKIIHQPSIKNSALIQYGISFFFFSEEDLEVSLSSPFFQKTDYLQYGSVVPGTVNIGSWFRRINLELNLWNNVTEIEIKKDEPLAYFSFSENVQIELKRFYMSDKLYEISSTLSDSGLWEPGVSLKKRYERFKKSRTNELVLKEIKKNLL